MLRWEVIGTTFGIQGAVDDAHWGVSPPGAVSIRLEDIVASLLKVYCSVLDRGWKKENEERRKEWCKVSIVGI